MASIYKRSRSPFWWIKYRDKTGILRQESTRLRYDQPRDTAKAHLLSASRSVEELSTAKRDKTMWFEAWVRPWLGVLCNNPGTYRKYANCWTTLSEYLASVGIVDPSGVSYETAFNYLVWRTKARSGRSGTRKNTAVYEIRMLRRVMSEAVRRGYCASNPLRDFKLNAEPVREKREITDTDLAVIIKALAQEPDWMRISFMIGLYTGCRLADTRLALKNIDLAGNVLHFPNPTKSKHGFSIPIHPHLRQVLANALNEQRSHVFDLPSQAVASIRWRRFFDRLNMPYCFHCLRVTFITRGARAGVDERSMMRLVNHSSTTIHRIYQKLTTQDLTKAQSEIPLPSFEKA